MNRVKTCLNHSFSSGGHTTCKCANFLLVIKWSVKAIYIYAITIWFRLLRYQAQQRSIQSIPTHSTLSGSIFTPLIKVESQRFQEVCYLRRKCAVLEQCLAPVVLAPAELTAALSPVSHLWQWRIQFRKNSGKLLF